MTNQRTFGADRWIGSVRTNTTRLAVLPGNVQAVLSNQRYHMFRTSSLPPSLSGVGLLSFINSLAAAIAGSTGYTIQVKAQDQADELDRSCTRLMWRALSSGSPVLTFGFNFAHANTQNFDPRWLGYALGTTSVVADADGWLRAPFGMWGVWCSSSEFGGRARRKTPGRRIDRRWSAAERVRASSATWDRWDTRLFEYTYIPGAIVHPDLARDPQRAQWGGVQPGSPTQNFLTIWEQLGDGLDVLVVHDVGQESGLDLVEGKTELVRVLEGDWTDFGQVAIPQDVDAKDVYVIAPPPLYIKAGRYEF